MDILSEVALFFEKIHRVVKNKVHRCRTPLNEENIIEHCILTKKYEIKIPLIEIRIHCVCSQPQAGPQAFDDILRPQSNEWMAEGTTNLLYKLETNNKRVLDKKKIVMYVYRSQKPIPMLGYIEKVA